MRRARAAVGAVCLAWAAVALAADGGAEAGAPGSFDARVDPQRVLLGEPFEYRIAVTHAPTQRFELEPPADWGPFELLDIQRSRTDASDRSVTTYRLKLQLFELGTHRLPDLAFQVTEGERTRKLTVPGREVQGLSSLPDGDATRAEALDDVRGPEPVYVRSFWLLWALGGAAALAGLGFAARRWWSQRGVRAAPAPPPLPLDVRTRQALDALAARRLARQGRSRELYFQLEEILRGYLGERFGFDALDRTTKELWEALDGRPTPGLPREELAAFLARAELVKFAKVDAPEDECSQALAFGYALLDKTHARGPHVP